MNKIIEIIYLILTVYLAVFIHESGHFILMNKYNVKIDEFIIGEGKILFKIKMKKTTFVLKSFPSGGVCIMKNTLDFIELNKKQKILILLNGTIFNLIFGIIFIIFYLFTPSTFIKYLIIWNIGFFIAFFVSMNNDSDMRTAIRVYKNQPFYIKDSLRDLISSLKSQIEDLLKSKESIDTKIENVNFVIQFFNKHHGFPNNIYKDKNEDVNEQMIDFYNELISYKESLEEKQ